MIHYRSLEQVSRAVRQRIEQMAEERCHRYAWATGVCEPISFHAPEQPFGNAELAGRSVVGRGRPRIARKTPNATAPCLPEGDVPQLISVLCELSAAWNLTWELRWEPDGQPVARIDDGRCDAGVFDHILSEVNAERAAEWIEEAEAEVTDEEEAPESLPISKQQRPGEGGMRLADLLIDTWTGADLSKLSIQIAELDQRAQQTHILDRDDDEEDPFTDGPATLPFPAR